MSVGWRGTKKRIKGYCVDEILNVGIGFLSSFFLFIFCWAHCILTAACERSAGEAEVGGRGGQTHTPNGKLLMEI